MKTPKGEINDGLLELLKNEELMTQMSKCANETECYDLVKNKLDINFEDFKSSMALANDYLKESETGLLSDDDLDQVAGGKSGGDIARDVISTAATVAGAAASAAAA